MDAKSKLNLYLWVVGTILALCVLAVFAALWFAHTVPAKQMNRAIIQLEYFAHCQMSYHYEHGFYGANGMTASCENPDGFSEIDVVLDSLHPFPYEYHMVADSHSYRCTAVCTDSSSNVDSLVIDQNLQVAQYLGKPKK